MAKPPIDDSKVLVFSGAGISAESGIATYRDSNGMWNDINPEDVASKRAWDTNPTKVLSFFNERRRAVAEANPNRAHEAVKRLEDKFNVVVITQNVDDLHERAGSSSILHLHGSMLKARGDGPGSKPFENGLTPINIGDFDDQGNQLRPHVVLFGEDMLYPEEAKYHFLTAGKILVVGTSLNVYPAAGLLKKGRFHADKKIVSYEVQKVPFGYDFIRGRATELVPRIVDSWLSRNNR